MNQARLNPRPGPLGATGKGARVKRQPERFGATIPSSAISPPKRRPQTGFKCPKFTIAQTPKPEKKRRLPKDRKTKLVRAETPSPQKQPETTAETSADTIADRELARLAKQYTSQLDYMSVDEIMEEAEVPTPNTSNENAENVD